MFSHWRLLRQILLRGGAAACSALSANRDAAWSLLPMTELLVIRHGETAWNREGRFQGHRQSELNALGRQQVARLAARLSGESVQALYSSDLLRAQQTAAAIAVRCDLSVRVERSLREWDLGVLAGLTRELAAREHPQDFAIYRHGLVDAMVTGGESVRQRYARIIAAMQAIAAAHSGQTVAVVTHGGPLGDCYRHATAMPLEAARGFQLYNASINRFDVDGERWRLLSWSDTTHLDGMDTLGNWEGAR
jgi:probable phosphoglycerate mutase